MSIFSESMTKIIRHFLKWCDFQASLFSEGEWDAQRERESGIEVPSTFEYANYLSFLVKYLLIEDNTMWYDFTMLSGGKS